MQLTPTETYLSKPINFLPLTAVMIQNELLFIFTSRANVDENFTSLWFVMCPRAE